MRLSLLPLVLKLGRSCWTQLHLNALKQRGSGLYIKGFDMCQCDRPQLLETICAWHTRISGTSINCCYIHEPTDGNRSIFIVAVQKGNTATIMACLIVNDQILILTISSLKSYDKWLLILIAWKGLWNGYYSSKSLVLSKRGPYIDMHDRCLADGLTCPDVTGRKKTSSTPGSSCTLVPNAALIISLCFGNQAFYVLFWR